MEGLNSRYADVTARREALERDRASAAPQDRAALDTQILAARDQERIVRIQVEEANGFSGAGGPVDVKQDEVTKEVEAEQSQAPQTVFQKQYLAGDRLTGALGALAAERVTETHVHPDIAEARQANARTAQIREQLDTERQEREAEKDRREAVAAKDRERAERVFDGGRGSEGFGTKDYLAVDQMHRASTLEFASNADAMEANDRLEQEVIGVLSEETDIEHIVMEDGTSIEGEVMDEIEVKGVAYYTVEFSDESGQTRRALIPASGQNYSVGDVIEVERRLGYHIQSGSDYGR